MAAEVTRALLGGAAGAPPAAAEGGSADAPPPPRLFVDCTLGGGGHAALLCAGLAAAGAPFRLLGLDRDVEAVAAAGAALAPWRAHATLVHASYVHLEAACAAAFAQLPHRPQLSGVLVDLGVSSHQLDAPHRGFSVRADRDGPLDMRFDASSGGLLSAPPPAPVPAAPPPGLTAAELVNHLPVRELARVFAELGEARHASAVAEAVAYRRAAQPVATTQDLAAVIAAAVDRAAARRRASPGARPPATSSGGGGGGSGAHPATQYFQALRIAVNGELDAVAALLRTAPRLLAPGGRLVVLTFHSLEDRLVKRAFAALCAPGGGGGTAFRHVAAEEVLAPTAAEVAANPRARPAKLRAIERGSTS
jgi:16S rRNA (cytosine1402-N4)-methyltransferase